MSELIEILAIWMYLFVGSFIAGYVLFAGCEMVGRDADATLCLLFGSFLTIGIFVWRREK